MEFEGRLASLDSRIEEIEKQFGSQIEIMSSINEEMKRISRGLYGDKDNQTKGLIERQREDEGRLADLERRIAEIEKGINNEIINIKNKNSAEELKKNTLMDFLKKIKEWGITILIIILVFKNVVGLDFLLEFVKK